MVNMSSSLISQTVTPFLREHIPSNYAPISKVDNDENSMSKDPNSKFCYRHRPDSKCRKAADESKMGMIQRVCLDISNPSFFFFFCVGSVVVYHKANTLAARSLISCLLRIDRLSHMCGPSLVQRRRDTASSC